MAKRRKSKKTTHRRRRISGLALSANSPLVTLAPIAAGYLLGDKINAPIESATGSLDPKLVAGIEAVAGFLLRSKGKGVLPKVLGGVLLGAGVKKGLKEFGVISGLPTVNGYRDLRTVNGLPRPVRKVAGVPGAGLSPSMQVIGAINGDYTDR